MPTVKNGSVSCSPAENGEGLSCQLTCRYRSVTIRGGHWYLMRYTQNEKGPRPQKKKNLEIIVESKHAKNWFGNVKQLSVD